MRRNLLNVILVAVVSLAVFWAPFLLRVEKFWGIDFEGRGMEAIVSNFDGVNFLMVAKSWYSPERLQGLVGQIDPGQDVKYYSAHYPLTAGVVWAFSQTMSGPRAVMASVVVGNVLLAYGLYVFFQTFVGKKQAWWLTLVALFLPARALSVRGVLSTEIFFVPLTLLSLVAAKNERHWLSAGYGALAVLTRSPGIILFGGYFLSIWLGKREWREKVKATLPYLLIPLTLLGLWGYYGWQYGSVLAYFQSGDNLHLFFPPFRVFGTSESWVSGMWREEIIYIYLLFVAGLVSWRNKNVGAAWWYPILFMVTILFVSHRDIARYSLPVAPFVIGGLAKILEVKWMRWIMVGMVIPIYLLGWLFVLSNMQPVADWTVLL